MALSLLRMPKSLHAALSSGAESEDVSFSIVPGVWPQIFSSRFDFDEFLLMFCDPLYMNSARSQNMGSHCNGNGATKSKLPSPTFFFNVSMIVMKSS